GGRDRGKRRSALRSPPSPCRPPCGSRPGSPEPVRSPRREPAAGRGSSPPGRGHPARPSRGARPSWLLRTESLDQVVHLGGAQLVGDAVGDQARGGARDLLPDLQAVLLRRAGGGGVVNYALGE